jgi:hypothetical protein
MIILQLFIFALLFTGFGIYSFLHKKKFIGVTFALLGLMLLIVAFTVVAYYPQTLPF